MTMFETDHYSKAPLKGNGGFGGWNTLNRALLRTFYVMICLTLLLAWDSTRSLAYYHVTQRLLPSNSQVQFRFGLLTAEGMAGSALWASAEEGDGHGQSTVDSTDPWQVTSAEVDHGDEFLGSSHDNSVRPPNGMRSPGVDLDDRMMTRDEYPLPNALNLSTSVETQSETQFNDTAEPILSAKSLIGESRPIAEVNISTAEIVGPQFSQEQIIELEGSGSKGEVCDFTRGQWVKDEARRPFYSGKKCKAYLADSFACREMNRPNYEYEKLRWQPEECEVPPFTGNGFLERLRNKVVAFVGDSLGRQQFQSLMCMITEGKEDHRVEDVQSAWGVGKWAYRFQSTNTTILFHWSASLCEIEAGNPNEKNGYFAMHLDRPAAFLKNSLHKLDLVVLNTGHHWNRAKLETNKWRPYVDGRPLMDRKLSGMAEALNFTVHKVVQWLDGKLADVSSERQASHPTVFFRTLSPRHFKNGDWNSGGTCDTTRPQYGPPGNTDTDSKVVVPAARVYRGPITERVAENAVKGTRVHLLNITHLSKLREESHISKYGRGKDSNHQDCLHWCLPGVPDVWNELLFGNLVSDPSLSP